MQNELKTQLTARMSLIDLLVASGLNVDKVAQHYTCYFPEFFYCLGEVALIEKLKSHGIAVHLNDEQKADVLKELAWRGLDAMAKLVQQ